MEHIEKALHSIIKYSEYREWTQRPFTIGNNVYSTDGESIVKVPKEFVSTFVEFQKEEIVKRILYFFNFKPQNLLTVNVQDLKDTIGKIPLIDECRNSDEDGKCKECDGRGEVEWEYEEYTKEMDCPICDGDGVIPDHKKEKTGRKIRSKGYFVDFNETIIRTCIIEQLINISCLLKVDEIELISQTAPNNEIVFKVGIAEILTRSVLHEDEQNILKRYKID